VSHREDDGGNTTASGDGGSMSPGHGEEPSPEEEIRDWLGETEDVASKEGDPAERGWLGRVFGRSAAEQGAPHGEEPAASNQPAEEGERSGDSEPSGYDPRLAADPDELAIFSAIPGGIDPDSPSKAAEQTEAGAAAPTEAESDGDDTAPVEPSDDEGAPTDERSDEAAAISAEAETADEEALPTSTDAEVAEEIGGDDEPEHEPADVVELSQSADTPTQPTFPELWEESANDLDDDYLDPDVIDFSTFTSEDYLQATTREYAGLAEAVARAEEENTERLAVSAEIPGLESGVVGLDDVVSATEGDSSADVIEPPSGSELSVRVLTALGLLILFGASLLSPYGIGALIIVVLAIAAGEMYAALMRGGYRPLSVFGFLGVLGAFAGTWMSGPVAIPIALLLTVIAVLLFYATSPGRRAPLENASLTILVAVWIGGLGGFAFDFLGSDDYRWLILALVVTVAIMDIAQYFIGRRLGKRQLAPVVSPNKTVEGYIAGVLVAIGIGAAFSWAEPFDLQDGLVIGAVVAVIAPMGDLAVSVLKRALGVKDMGYILPGHGGILDRVDAMIMTIPALWIAYSWMGLIS
jgi:phosphatidate cytidylyltransferase